MPGAAALESAYALVYGLRPLCAYEIRARAVNSVGTSGWSKRSAAVVTLSTTPAPVQFMEVLRIGLNWVDVGWIPASDDGGVAVTQYEISALSVTGSVTDGSAVSVVVVSEAQATKSADEHAALATVASTPEDAEDSAAKLAFDRLEVLLGTSGSATAATAALPPVRTQLSIRAGHLTGLAAGASYQLHVRPANENGWGAKSSSPLTFQTMTCKPDMPTCVRGTSKSLTGALVTWLPPAFDGGVVVELYTVQHATYVEAEAQALVWGGDAASDPRACTHVFAGLERGKSFVFRVRARNAHGSSRWSEPSPPLLIPPTCPDQPHRPTLTVLGPHSVLLAIDAAFSNGGFPVKGFAAQCRAKSRSTPSAEPDDAGSVKAAVAELSTVYETVIAATEHAAAEKAAAEQAAAKPAAVAELTTVYETVIAATEQAATEKAAAEHAAPKAATAAGPTPVYEAATEKATTAEGWADVGAKLVSSDEARARIVATLVAHRLADGPSAAAQAEAPHDGHFDQAPRHAHRGRIVHAVIRGRRWLVIERDHWPVIFTDLLAGFGDAERTDGVAHPGRAVGSRNYVRTRLRQAHAQVACAKRNESPRDAKAVVDRSPLPELRGSSAAPPAVRPSCVCTKSAYWPESSGARAVARRMRCLLRNATLLRPQRRSRRGTGAHCSMPLEGTQRAAPLRPLQLVVTRTSRIATRTRLRRVCDAFLRAGTSSARQRST